MVDSLASRASRRGALRALRGEAPLVVPSLLLCDFGQLRRQVERLEAAGVRALHLDVMDGHFVPNLSYGLPLVEAFHGMTHLPLDVHLMISNPAEYIDRYAAAGTSGMTIHLEAAPDPRPLLRRIRELGLSAGLAINPATPVERVADILDECDLVLVMSVSPGFGGQVFESSALDKLRWLRGRVRSDVLLEVDGGVNERTIGACAEAGAHVMVVGSAVLKQNDYQAAVGSLTAVARSHSGGPPRSQ
jgi:ribulose-phosphate 3-epimerase